MRTINVDALIEKFAKDKFDRCRDDYQSGYNDGMLHAEVVADNFPTVDAVPVDWITRYMNHADITSVIRIRVMIDVWREEHENDLCR